MKNTIVFIHTEKGTSYVIKKESDIMFHFEIDREVQSSFKTIVSALNAVIEAMESKGVKKDKKDNDKDKD